MVYISCHRAHLVLLRSLVWKKYDSLIKANVGLGDLFHDNVRRNPHAEAVVDGNRVLTYAQLHKKSLQLAKHLREDESFQPEEPVGIIVNAGANNVVAQVAVNYAGGSCVPLDPSLPYQQIDSRLFNVGSRLLVVDADNQNRLSSYDRVSVDQKVPTATEPGKIDDIPVTTTLDHRTHLLYTSGTTGEPKTVQILARGLLHLLYHLPFPSADARDRVGHVSSITFDIAMFEIWAPLLRGAIIVILNRSVLLDPIALAERIERYRVTVLCITPAVLNLAAATCPLAFAQLRVLTLGGEAPNRKAIRKVLESGPPGRLINCYGPTECTVMALTHRVTLDDVWTGDVGIGKPLGRTLLYILDDTFSPVPDEHIGELFIGGAGVSPGYLGQPEKNASSFFNIAGLSQSDTPIRLYRTGDLVKRRKSGLIDYHGRRDNQVKIRGYRIELEAVEAALMKTELFSSVVALKIDSPLEGAGGMLVAYAVPVSLWEGLQSDATGILGKLLPSYMVPRIELISELTLNSHGKIDRKTLAGLSPGMWQARLEPADLETPNTISELKRAWSEILAIPTRQLDSRSDFFLLGGTSLQAALFIHGIRRDLRTEVSLLALYENSTLAALAAFIDASQKGKVATKDERETWLADAKLAQGLQLPPGQLRNWRADTEGRVLLTGATGFVGAHLLRRLLDMPDVLQVGCLVRASSPAHGLSRIRRSLERHQLWEEPPASKLPVLPGALEEGTLGLAQDRFQAIAGWASVVFHLGAHVNYTQPYSVHRSPNVLGTVNVLRLAATGRLKPLHYISSLSTFGPTGFINGVSHVREDESLMPHLDALRYDDGYSQSQWVALCANGQGHSRVVDSECPISVAMKH